MACPYFYPVAKAEDVPQPARAPLGAVYRGRCDLGGSAEYEACNFGYARDLCPVFPADAEADAVRFTKFGGRTIFILERNYLPVKHGEAGQAPGVLARQAEVFDQWLKP